jgi:hypothetical protein
MRLFRLKYGKDNVPYPDLAGPVNLAELSGIPFDEALSKLLAEITFPAPDGYEVIAGFKFGRRMQIMDSMKIEQLAARDIPFYLLETMTGTHRLIGELSFAKTMEHFERNALATLPPTLYGLLLKASEDRMNDGESGQAAGIFAELYQLLCDMPIPKAA